PFRRGSAFSSTHHHCRTGDRSHIAESAPQCAPHHRAVSNGLHAARHRPAPFHTTQMLRARTKQQTEPECTQTQSTPSLAEALSSHGVTTFKNTPAIAGRMQFPCQPRKETQQLCGVKITAPRCCPHFTWQDKLHARMVPDPSPFECTSTEHVKKYVRTRRHLITQNHPPSRSRPPQRGARV
ncbi:hypothetical protein TcG_12797, partial [Trypanosoma cruzi]